jgi:hypothetical protein
MCAVLAAGLSTLPSSFASFFRSEFVSGAFLVSGFAAFAGNLTLLRGIHRSESAAAAFGLTGRFLFFVFRRVHLSAFVSANALVAFSVLSI